MLLAYFACILLPCCDIYIYFELHIFVSIFRLLLEVLFNYP